MLLVVFFVLKTHETSECFGCSYHSYYSSLELRVDHFDLEMRGSSGMLAMPSVRLVEVFFLFDQS